jgi:hypothetical protein
MTGAGQFLIKHVFNSPVTYKQIANLNSSYGIGTPFGGFAVTSNGYVYIQNGNLYFYDNNSKLINTIDAPENTNGFHSITVNGDDILVSGSSQSINPSSDSEEHTYNPFIIGFDFHGNQLWKTNLPAGFHINYMNSGSIIGDFTNSINIKTNTDTNGRDYNSIGGTDVAILTYHLSDSGIGFNDVEQIGSTNNDYSYALPPSGDSNNYILLNLAGDTKIVSSNSSSDLSTQQGIYLCDTSGIYSDIMGDPHQNIGWIRSIPGAISVAYSNNPTSENVPRLFVLSNIQDSNIFGLDNSIGNVKNTAKDHNKLLEVSLYNDQDGSIINKVTITSLGSNADDGYFNTIAKTDNDIFVIAQTNNETQIIKLDKNLNILDRTNLHDSLAVGEYKYNNAIYLASYNTKRSNNQKNTSIVVYKLTK